MSFRRTLGVLFSALIIAGGCSRERPAASMPAEAPAPARRKVVFQTDWFPQAEHGGFYQALVKGFYSDLGLEVEIRPGGPGVGIKVPVAKGEIDFGMNRSDDVLVVASRGLPLVMVAAVLQHDPQALMVHQESPVKSFRDLKGRSVTASIGMAWIPFLQKKYGIKFDLKPNTYGLAAFLADRDSIQQCFVTSEPFFAQERGVRVRTLPLAESGYDVYHVIFCRRELVREAPELVRAFVAASLRGWRDYLGGNPAAAHAEILKRNPQMSAELLQYSREELLLRSLVTGDRNVGEDIGQLSLPRLAREMDALLDLNIMDAPVSIGSVATREFLPPAPR